VFQSLLRLQTFTGIPPILTKPLLTMAPNSTRFPTGSHLYSVIYKGCQRLRERELRPRRVDQSASELTFDRTTTSSRSATCCPRHLDVPEPNIRSRTLVIFCTRSVWLSSSARSVIQRDGSNVFGLVPNTFGSLIVAPKHNLGIDLATIPLEV
jgi:hypothetical protein